VPEAYWGNPEKSYFSHRIGLTGPADFKPCFDKAKAESKQGDFLPDAFVDKI